MIRCIMLGGGGHAGVLIDILKSTGGVALEGILDKAHSKIGSILFGVEVVGSDERLPALAGGGVTHFVVGLGGVGDNSPRRRLFELGLESGLKPLTLMHPKAIVSGLAIVGDGSQMLPGSIINAGARIGRNVLINSGAVVEHDCEIGDHAHIATGAVLASGVRVGEGSHVGAGAVVRQGITIGSGVVVGAGAAVVDDVPSGHVVVGVPAVRIR